MENVTISTSTTDRLVELDEAELDLVSGGQFSSATTSSRITSSNSVTIRSTSSNSVMISSSVRVMMAYSNPGLLAETTQLLNRANHEGLFLLGVGVDVVLAGLI